jgi:hypothetical protein
MAVVLGGDNPQLLVGKNAEPRRLDCAADGEQDMLGPLQLSPFDLDLGAGRAGLGCDGEDLRAASGRIGHDQSGHEDD